MAEKIDGTGSAVINNIKFTQQMSHPASPSAGSEVLYVVSGSSHGGLYLKDSGGRVIGPFITGTSASVSPGYEYDYVESTTPLSVTATSEGTAQTFISGGSVSYDGSTKICIEFFAPRIKPDANAGRYIVVIVLEDSTVLGQFALLRTPAAGTDDKPVLVRRFRTPSAGSHAYTVKAWVSAGTGSIDVGAGGAGTDIPAYLRITKA